MVIDLFFCGENLVQAHWYVQKTLLTFPHPLIIIIIVLLIVIVIGRRPIVFRLVEPHCAIIIPNSYCYYWKRKKTSQDDGQFIWVCGWEVGLYCNLAPFPHPYQNLPLDNMGVPIVKEKTDWMVVVVKEKLCVN